MRWGVRIGIGALAVLAGALVTVAWEPARSEVPDLDQPQVIPILDCRPSEADGGGTATLAPAEPLPAGSVASFVLTYRAPPEGISPGGFVLLQISPWWGWSEPQTSMPGRAGFVRVERSPGGEAQAAQALALNRVLVPAGRDGFPPNGTLTFHYGPARVDRYAESEELFQVFVDGDGDGHYACIEEPPRLRILPRESRRLVVSVPSRCQPGDAVPVRVAGVDSLGNRVDLPPGEYRLTLAEAETEEPVLTRQLDRPGSLLKLEWTAAGPGAHRLDFQGPGGLRGRSNVLFCQPGEPKLNLYFGDLHGHTRLSDGTGTPEDYYRFAREVAGLDLAAVTDHADYGTIPLEGAAWQRIRKATEGANEPGRFVTFLGYEWTNWIYGHRNVYFRGSDGPVFRSIDPASDTPQELWSLLEPHQAMTVAHHVGGGPIHTDWSIPPHPMEPLVEICSIHGSSEVFGGESSIYNPVRGAFVRDALDRGYRLGIIASGDTHDGHPGRRTEGARVNGILGVFARELTREALWEAFHRRHVYGTTGAKILLFFRVADSPMGSEVTWPEGSGALPIALMAVGCAPIRTVEIIRDGQVILQEPGQGLQARLLVEDPAPPAEGTSWYYARILQQDGEMAWSSPVWVTGVPR